MSLRLDDQLCFALYSAQRALTRAYAELLEPLGLTYPQYLVCLALWERDGRSVTSLGDALCLDSGTLTPLLKRMETAGLVSRARSGDDERVVEIHLTATGKALKAKAVGIPKQLGKLAGMDAGQVASLREELTRLSSVLTRTQ